MLSYYMNSMQTNTGIKHLAELNIEGGSFSSRVITSVERYDFAIQISKKHPMKRFLNKYNYPVIAT